MNTRVYLLKGTDTLLALQPRSLTIALSTTPMDVYRRCTLYKLQGRLTSETRRTKALRSRPCSRPASL